jgi:hypothetical protein
MVKDISLGHLGPIVADRSCIRIGRCKVEDQSNMRGPRGERFRNPFFAPYAHIRTVHDGGNQTPPIWRSDGAWTMDISVQLPAGWMDDGSHPCNRNQR